MQTGEIVIVRKGRFRDVIWCVDSGLKIPVGESHSGCESSEGHKTIRPRKYRYFLVLDKEESKSQRAGRKIFELSDCQNLEWSDNLCLLPVEDKELIKTILEAKEYE